VLREASPVSVAKSRIIRKGQREFFMVGSLAGMEDLI